MTKRQLCFIAWILLPAASLSAIPGLDLSAGPCLGAFSPSLKTLNQQVLVYEYRRPELGSAVELSLQGKTAIPLMGLGAGINFGRWSNGDKWSAPAGPGGIYTDTREYKITIYPLEAFADYSLPFVPMVLKGRAGGSLGIAWAALSDDVRRVVNATGVEDRHTYFTAKGSTPYLGIYAGLDLVSIPKVTVGFDLGYRMGKVEQLEIKRSSEPTHVGTILQYYDHARDQRLPLPLELNGLYARLVARYHF